MDDFGVDNSTYQSTMPYTTQSGFGGYTAQPYKPIGGFFGNLSLAGANGPYANYFNSTGATLESNGDVRRRDDALDALKEKGYVYESGGTLPYTYGDYNFGGRKFLPGHTLLDLYGAPVKQNLGGSSSAYDWMESPEAWLSRVRGQGGTLQDLYAQEEQRKAEWDAEQLQAQQDSWSQY